MASECWSPAAMAAAVRVPGSAARTGRGLELNTPCPSCPCCPSPQQSTEPSVRIARPCRLPIPRATAG
eukprot:3178571-Rhodomonas_salina.2